MSSFSIKSNSMTIDKEFVDLMDMSPKEISSWLNTLVDGLVQRKSGNTEKSFRSERE